jgi:Asp-tRNA(Asn)/Glu-tRNA(Gln) amidotransferase A subunit family amidase
MMRRSLFTVGLLFLTGFPMPAQDPGPADDLPAVIRWLGLSVTPDQIGQLKAQALRERTATLATRETPADPSIPQPLVFRPFDESRLRTVPDGFNWEPRPMPSLPEKPEDLAWLGVADLAALLKARQVTSEQLTRLSLQRLRQFGPALNCTVTLLEVRALAAARRADLEIKSGHWRGPLHGIPYGAKDLLDVAGFPSTWGVGVRSNAVPSTDATVIARLDAAGAVLVAKLSLGELAMGDVWFGGKTRNPWNPESGSSGSSAGSAAAVAAGLLPFAIGSETLGSLVSPATVCHVTALRPTFGRVPRTGAMTLCASLDKLGPLARSAEDCALVLDVIRGPDGRDRSVIPGGFQWDNRTDLRGMRVGVLRTDLEKDEGGWPHHQATLALLERLGVILEDVTLPRHPAAPLRLILSAEASASFEPWIRDGRADGLVQQEAWNWPNQFRAARLIPAVEYLEANRARAMLADAMEELLVKFDAVITPPWTGDTLLFSNFSGHPCVVIPNGPKVGSKPATVCWIGRWFGEASLLRIARACQNETRWHTIPPPGS